MNMTNVTQGPMLLDVNSSSILAFCNLQYRLEINMDPATLVGTKGSNNLTISNIIDLGY